MAIKVKLSDVASQLTDRELLEVLIRALADIPAHTYYLRKHRLIE